MVVLFTLAVFALGYGAVSRFLGNQHAQRGALSQFDGKGRESDPIGYSFEANDTTAVVAGPGNNAAADLGLSLDTDDSHRDHGEAVAAVPVHIGDYRNADDTSRDTGEMDVVVPVHIGDYRNADDTGRDMGEVDAAVPAHIGDDHDADDTGYDTGEANAAVPVHIGEPFNAD